MKPSRQIELVYDPGCPNVAATRERLRLACARAGIESRWREWDLNAEDAPAHVHGYGSPTVLVNGEDVTGAPPEGADACCRIYAADDGGNRGVPRLDDMVRALRRASGGRAAGVVWSVPSALSAVGVALLPKLICPACWPAYAGLLASLGIGFFDYTPYLPWATAVFLALVLGLLAFGAKARRSYGPLAAGLAASALILAGRFILESEPPVWAGVVLLVGACAWNAWFRFRGHEPHCSGCISQQEQPSP